MSPDYEKFLVSHTSKMQEKQMMTEVMDSHWGVPAMVIEKPNKKGYRMVADFRRLNQQIYPTSIPLPLPDSLLGNTHDATYYGVMDNLKGFNSLPVEDPHKCLVLITPFGCFQMNVAPQGFLNSPNIYQHRITNEVLKGLHGSICSNWIDDLLVFAPTEAIYLRNLEQVFQRYKEFNVKLNMEKCDLFQRKVKWCGRILSAGTIAFDPGYYTRLTSLPAPTTVLELHDFFFALSWVQSSLDPVRYLQYKPVLMKFLNKVFGDVSKKGSRKKVLLSGKKLSSYDWGIAEDTAYHYVCSYWKTQLLLLSWTQ
jgi:hypothetical protein